MFAALKPGPEQQPDGVIDDSGLAVVDVRGLHYPLTAALLTYTTITGMKVLP